ncbi:MAG: Transcriptional regulator of nonfermentable carbon utilization [Bathelium mastoideum]|nr:MAG: Transcriptional regulator of nonfermentable carbon utilization [Bathelium mastoideum]
MPPDAEDASSPSSAEPSGEHDTGEMAEHLETRADSDDSPPRTQPETTGQKPPSSAKDPSRPRRKKARRACFACQRAHLTCGDERPCQRCIKRGLQDACQDGVRKKAKYLHDAPDGALMPGVGGHYPHLGHENPSLPGSNGLNTGPLGPQSQYFPQVQAGGYAIYPQSTNGPNMPPPLPEMPIMNQFNAQRSPISSQFSSTQSQQTSPIHGLNGSQQQHHQPYTDALFDPSDPGLFNFDLASLNFGNHYGALELSMLGHMSSAVDTPHSESNLMQNVTQSQPTSGSFSGPITSPQGFADNLGQRPDFMYAQDAPMADWQGQPDSAHGSGGMVYNAVEDLARRDSHNALPRAFAIGAGPPSIPSASPTSTGADGMIYDSTAPMSPSLFVNSPTQQQNFYNRQNPQLQQAHAGSVSGPAAQSQPTHQHEKHVSLPKNMRLPASTALSNTRARDRDPSSIYSSVTAPYAYTNSFHGLITVLLKRLPKQKVVRIAECMSYFRPTFIACTRTLNRQDLIFMEQGFQRMLWEYEDFINAYGTPSIICRRTGEVVGVNKEFSSLTGWSRDVLLGKEQNLNVNNGREDGVASGITGINTTGNRSSFNTARGPATGNYNNDPSSTGSDSTNGSTNDGGAVSNGENRHQPVYIAELLDDDSIIRFYEDFSMLAFGDARGSVMNPCKLLKYRTDEDIKEENDSDFGDHNLGSNDTKQRMIATGAKSSKAMPLNLAHSIHNEAGMHALGKREGKVDCMYCWTTRRDVWDMPMLIVMNFLPKI